MDSALASYRGQAAWPELIHGRPAVVHPQQFAAAAARDSDGWPGQQQPEGWAQPHPPPDSCSCVP
ncbi:hypothetical protein ACFU7Y_03520 [Kitasatospora sp. NPDC057542]|uniref:hypothetical protein n=1 Tax=Streptomycetaceae TaxID=2062 RepID=UPI001CCD6A60|nr:hypothetical protein [Streptomyces sp. LS1784]